MNTPKHNNKSLHGYTLGKNHWLQAFKSLQNDR